VTIDQMTSGAPDAASAITPAPDPATFLAPRGGWLARARGLWREGFLVRSEVAFALGCSVLWTVFYNVSFWHQAFAALWHPAASAVLFFLSLAVVVVSLQAFLLLAMPTRFLMKAGASLLFLIAAPTSYFIDTYSAVMNKDMMRNVLQTDRGEASALVTAHLVLYVVVLGIVPAIMVWAARIPERSWKQRARHQGAFVAGAIAAMTLGLFASSANYAVFFREHKPVRFSLSPLAPVASMAQLAGERRRHVAGTPLSSPEGRAARVEAGSDKPLVVFLVIGETARAANFQLGGYERPTTPRLAATPDVVYFDQATSCGTSTAVSVPCVFSPGGQAHFAVQDAADATNLLDSLIQAGLDVEWRDNNAGCKGVCARVPTRTYGGTVDPSACPDGHCYDVVMSADLGERLRDVRRDTVIVFHQNGSHGPAYYARYPAAYEKFTPACRSNELHRCSAQEVVNAYDNTIAYTDRVLSEQIEFLRANQDRFDSLLLYVSDHGESLGEQGIYLHGLPYHFAPSEQTHVPMLLWTSEGYRKRMGLELDCLRREAHGLHSHDDVYHTMLGATRVRNGAYSTSHDLLFSCRKPPGGVE
jgi:lipid A ethanolaminephosphotransferase